MLSVIVSRENTLKSSCEQLRIRIWKRWKIICCLFGMVLTSSFNETFQSLRLSLTIIDSWSRSISGSINDGSILVVIRDKLYSLSKEKTLVDINLDSPSLSISLRIFIRTISSSINVRESLSYTKMSIKTISVRSIKAIQKTLVCLFPFLQQGFRSRLLLRRPKTRQVQSQLIVLSSSNRIVSLSAQAMTITRTDSSRVSSELIKLQSRKTTMRMSLSQTTILVRMSILAILHISLRYLSKPPTVTKNMTTTIITRSKATSPRQCLSRTINVSTVNIRSPLVTNSLHIYAKSAEESL